MGCLWLLLMKPNTGGDYSDMNFTDTLGAISRVGWGFLFHKVYTFTILFPLRNLIFHNFHMLFDERKQLITSLQLVTLVFSIFSEPW